MLDRVRELVPEYPIGTREYHAAGVTPRDVERNLREYTGSDEELGRERTAWSGVLKSTYRWEVAPGDGEYVIHERVTVPFRSVAAVGALLAGLFWVSDLVLGSSVTGRTDLFVTIPALLVLLGALIVGFEAIEAYQPGLEESPLLNHYDERFGTQQDLLGGLVFTQAMVAIGTYLLGLPAVYAILYYGLYLVAPRSFERMLAAVIDTLKTGFRRVPALAFLYLGIVGIATIGHAIFLTIMNSIKLLQMMSTFSLTGSLITIMVVLCLLGFYANAYGILVDRAIRREFVSTGRSTDNLLVLIVASSCVLGGAGVVVWMIWSWIDTIQWVTQFVDGPLLLLLVLGAIGPGYFVAGTCYQLRSVLQLFETMRSTETRLDDPAFDDFAAEIRVLETDTIGAMAIAFPRDNRIVVTRGLVDQYRADDLDQSELKAILRHEEAHLERGDARLSILIALLSPVLLVGKNVLYSLFDYRTREIQADKYAADRTSPEALVGALGTLRDQSLSTRSFDTLAFAPSLNSSANNVQRESLPQRVFGFLYGGFAATDVHPDIDERIEQVGDEGMAAQWKLQQIGGSEQDR
ncbi:M48 family metalloprotease [Halopiger aswanensis]|uniref:Zn-dependent protease with chaperone function n=1 Tax=Halopiger aswanensis TaxID=148449 RepID=A0A3R7GEV9_9EURY|nr:M48 family metalloprotease [Halopiger aswanensis]RKD86246.1 Zn-dependent protease with chaperone function [Halopiger aswanensis]